MEDHTTGEILTTIFLCLAVVGGAVYGLFFVGTVWAVVGGAAVIGVAAVVVVTVLAFAADGVARLFKRDASR